MSWQERKMQFYKERILNAAQLKRLSEHKYSCTSASILDACLQPWWCWLVSKTPLWLAPNLITILGLIVNIVTTLILVWWVVTPSFWGFIAKNLCHQYLASGTTFVFASRYRHFPFDDACVPHNRGFNWLFHSRLTLWFACLWVLRWRLLSIGLTNVVPRLIRW